LEENPAFPLPAGPRLKILVAEDNVINQKVAVGILEKLGHRVVLADNGLNAVSLWESESFDLVLMDVQMPEMSGFEATAVIRKRDGRTHSHHCHDRTCHEGRPRTLPRSRNGRLYPQTDPGTPAAGSG